jgi:hypothetical protein
MCLVVTRCNPVLLTVAGEVDMSALDEFPLLMAALKEELKQELREELGQGQWLDQEHSVLGRNRHVAACKRLIRHDSTDAYYDGTDGRWMLRARAVDNEILRRNRELAERLPQSEPPPAIAPAMTPMPPVKATEAEHEEPQDETGIYQREWLERLRGAR